MRVQSAQEMNEALDAFSVRAKLTGSNTAMSRFMQQLFGSKKEPWVDQGADKTEISDNRPYETDNEKNQVADNNQNAQRIPIAPRRTTICRRRQTARGRLAPSRARFAACRSSSSAWCDRDAFVLF